MALERRLELRDMKTGRDIFPALFYRNWNLRGEASGVSAGRLPDRGKHFTGLIIPVLLCEELPI
jgi:hypothetical protein